jgi:precorrin-8X/cobalt-precorrin-8 methylmutase
MTFMDYNRDAHDIYRQSFAIIRAETDLTPFTADIQDVVIRVVHACGMPEVAADLMYSPQAATYGRTALQSGAPILCDSRMVAEGITRARLPAANRIICTLHDPQVPDLARQMANTRTAASIDLWQPELQGAIAVIGNAPTALFRLLELLALGAPRPALILGFPVGFVGAAESKDALATIDHGVPFITLRGRRGGSAMAVAAVNALGQDPQSH